MFRLDSSFSKYVISHCKIASREYNFILKNLPGEPWIMRIKAVKSAGKSVDEERKWQNDQLPSEVKELVLTTENYKHVEKV